MVVEVNNQLTRERTRPRYLLMSGPLLGVDNLLDLFRRNDCGVIGGMDAGNNDW